MYSILTGSIIISLLHAVIPNHWLPVIAIGRKEQWTVGEVRRVTLIAGLSHALSTVLIGVILGWVGKNAAENITNFTRFAAPVILVALGIFFIYRHHRHNHFHVDNKAAQQQTKTRMIFTLAIAMFFSPCLEIEAYFLLAGAHAKWLMACLALLYVVITTSGMVLLVHFAYKGVIKFNWHRLEHNAGIITGWTLIITGIISYFIS